MENRFAREDEVKEEIITIEEDEEKVEIKEKAKNHEEKSEIKNKEKLEYNDLKEKIIKEDEKIQEIKAKQEEKEKTENEEKNKQIVSKNDELIKQEEIIKVEVQTVDIPKTHSDRKVGFKILPQQSDKILEDKKVSVTNELGLEQKSSRTILGESFSWNLPMSDKQLEHEEMGKIDTVGIKSKITDEMLLERKQRQQVENSYQIEIFYKFQVEKVTSIIKKILNNELFGQLYESEMACQKAKDISQAILIEIKKLKYLRHKIISTVTIGQKSDQSLHMVNRNLWDTNFDNFATYTFENCSLFAVASVFALYYE